MGLREQIKNAKSDSEINTLLQSGQKYEFASARTKSAWKSTAKFRLAELSSLDPAQTPEKSVESKKVSKKKTK